MVRQRLTKFAFYRYRYVLAYSVFGLSLAALLTLAGLYLPGGLTDSEIKSVLISDSVNTAQLFSLPPDQLVYLPYRLLQSISIHTFGISIVSIKLPSIILGFASAIGLLYLFNLWYRKNVAIIAAIVAVTTNQFLLASQAGRAGISYIFLTTMVLIAASMIARHSTYAKIWALVGFALAAISLYMPLNIYMIMALILTALIHPHARYLIFKKSSKIIIAVGSVIALLLTSPLIAGILRDPSILKRLLGVPANFDTVLSDAQTMLQNYISFTAPTAGNIITPVYGLGLVILIAIGIYRLFTTKYTARSYLLSFWLVALVPLILLNPEFVSITFVPVMLLVALGVDYIISSWYKLFPQNPYARVFGLAPLGILIIGLVLSSIDHFAYGLHYDKAVYSSYSYDLPLLQKKLRSLDKDSNVVMITSKDTQAFYTSYANHQKQIKSLTITSNASTLPAADLVIAERSFVSSIKQIPTEILVTRSSENANRFYLYKNTES